MTSYLDGQAAVFAQYKQLATLDFMLSFVYWQLECMLPAKLPSPGISYEIFYTPRHDFA